MTRQLVGDDLVEAAAEMDRAGLAGRRGRPRDVALDREVDLERAGAVTEPAVRAGDRGPAADRRGCRRRSTATRPASTRRSAAGRRPRSRAHRSRSCRRGVRCRPPSASAIACEPPSATTHPLACAATISISPTALVIGRSRRENACAATPAHSALASRSSTPAPTWSPAASPPAPKRASVSGCRGTRRTGCEASANRSSKCDAIGSNTRRHRRPSLAERRRRSDRSIDTTRRPNRRRAGGRSPPPAAAR